LESQVEIIDTEEHRILWLHVLVLQVLDRDERRRFTPVRIRPPTHPLTCCNRRFNGVAIRPTLLNDIAGLTDFKNRAVVQGDAVFGNKLRRAVLDLICLTLRRR
jgi:hypothetical protein